MFNVLDLQNKLTKAITNNNLFEVIKEIAKEYVNDINVDTHGNLVCRQKGEHSKVNMIAQAFFPGFIAKDVDKHGFVRFQGDSLICPAYAANNTISFQNGIKGVICQKDSSGFSEKTSGEMIFNDLYIDIGATNVQEGLEFIRIDGHAYFDGQPKRAAGNCIVAPYASQIANYVIAILSLEALQGKQNGTSFIFAKSRHTHGKGGCCLKTSNIYLSACPAGGTPQNETMPSAFRTGNGPVISNNLQVIANNSNIKFQNKFSEKESESDLLIGIPVKNQHTPVEIISISDMEAALKLIVTVVNGLE